MATLKDNVKAYDALRDELEARHMGEWVVIYDKRLVGTFPEFHQATMFAIERFGRGPYHIKQIGEPPFNLSPTLTFGLNRVAD